MKQRCKEVGLEKQQGDQLSLTAGTASDSSVHLSSPLSIKKFQNELLIIACDYIDIVMLIKSSILNITSLDDSPSFPVVQTVVSAKWRIRDSSGPMCVRVYRIPRCTR